MSIVHIITGLNLGGAERVLYSLLTGGLRARASHRVISLTGLGHYGPRLTAEGVSVGCLDMQPGRLSPQGVLRLRQEVSSANPEVIQGWMYHGNLAASVARKIAAPKAALSWNIRQSLEGLAGLKGSTRLAISLGARISTGPDAIIYNSSRARAQHEARGYAPTRGRVIANGFNTRKWMPDPGAPHRLRDEAGLPHGAPLIGFVGRGHSDKDIPSLLEAFRKVSATNASAYLVCVGKGIRENFAGSVSGERVVYLGERHDVERLMPAFDLLCLSSSFEGFPNVIGEAMACGVPCVTTDVGDAATVVGETGWVVPPRDSSALAEALLQALAASPAERQARGQAARARIDTDYALDAVVARYNALYSDLASMR